MKIKNWLVSAVVLTLLGGALLVGVPAVNALAVGTSPEERPARDTGCRWAGISAAWPQMWLISCISLGDLQADRQSGKSMVQIAAEQSVSEQSWWTT